MFVLIWYLTIKYTKLKRGETQRGPLFDVCAGQSAVIVSKEEQQGTVGLGGRYQEGG